eukprot:TRINITY_DN430_c0_g1_i4.p1 TRINITY_DN430_c0_g1~~TRINITY_DN430_c0_g1_i4.p1  ORF type:complete len:583 (-),score=105.81 TRINITY_DN430_c0_g1_i4:249-1997(-)
MKRLFIAAIFCFGTVIAATADKPLAEEYFICDMCRWVLGTFRGVLVSPFTAVFFNTVGSLICKLRYERTVCEEFIPNMLWPFVLNGLNRVLNETITCKQVNFCKYPLLIRDDEKVYTYRLLKDKPPRKEVKLDPDDGNFTFVVFADAHVDQFYAENSEADCDQPLCCRATPSADSGLGLRNPAGKWGMVARCDLPPATFDYFLNYTIDELRPDFFLWLGDNSPHDVWNINKTKHMWGSRHIANVFKGKGDYGKLGRVYPIAGNHEAMPCDSFDFSKNSSWWILEELTEAWGNWYTDKCNVHFLIIAKETFKSIGCFSQLHPGTNLRIIGLFPLVSDMMNPYIWGNSTNILNVISWLESELKLAEENNESVYLLSHFSINSYFMAAQWGYRFRILIDRYANQIRGIFSGHTHEDSFEIIKSKLNEDISAVLHMVPSLTTYSQQNPSFRVYVADRKTFSILDYDQYRLYLNETSPRWTRVYSFRDFFKIPTVAYSSYPVAVAKLKATPPLFDRFVSNLWGEGPRGPALLQNRPSAMNFVICRLVSADLFEYLRCVGTDYGSDEYVFGYGILAKYMYSDWVYAYP